MLNAGYKMPDITAEQAWVWLECNRPIINKGVHTSDGFHNWEIMGIRSQGQYYLFSGQTLKECILKAMENN